MASRVPALLEEIQADLLTAARAKFDACIERATTWDAFMTALNNKHMVRRGGGRRNGGERVGRLPST